MKPLITLATLKDATSQEVFDQCARHMLTQNQKCKKENGNCTYRNEIGLKCAAGCLISDDEYKEQANYNSTENQFEECGSWGSVVQHGLAPDTKVGLIESLQNIHDLHLPENWPVNLILCAKKYDLNYSVVEEFQNQN